MKNNRKPDFKTFINKKLHTPTWLFVLLVIVLILRIPSFFEPYSYGDEMIYLALGEAIRQGIPLYKDIHDNKPPLLYILAGIAGSLFWFKVILALWSFVTIYIFWKFSEALFPKKEKLQKVSTIIFALLTTLPLFEGNIANAELFLVGPIIAAFLILFKRKLSPKNLILSGALFSIATLFKVPAAFDFPAIIFLWIATARRLDKKNLIRIAKNSFYLLVGFAVPILLTFIWYGMQGAFSEYLTAAFLQNVGYLSSFRPGDVQKSLLVRNAPLLWRALIVLGGFAILFWKRKKLSKEFTFITAWLLLTLFAVTLSERPYPHYLIQSAGPVSLLLGLLFTEDNIEQVLAIIPLTLTMAIPVYFNFWYYPTTPYYIRFIKLATGNLTRQEYLNTFGSQIMINYKISDYITTVTTKNDKIFVWGNGSSIYALSRRLPPIKYVADYHIKDFSSEQETVSALKKDMPQFIVILPDALSSSPLDSFVPNNYALAENIDGAEVWKLLRPGVRKLLTK
jgi:4-amino-4-deoxy-L-arabinose transferase-like glycosyltransferase